MKLSIIILSATALVAVTGFSPQIVSSSKISVSSSSSLSMTNIDRSHHSSENELSRASFLSTSASSSLLAIILSSDPSPAFARGRATLEQSYDRYTPRINAGSKFYADDLKRLIEKNDWIGIKAATSDPPPRSKEDKAKIDGGIAERAAKAGGFSDARVLVAADLYAASFSDNKISAKTKNMKEKVAEVRSVVEGMNLAARQALGEEKAEGGLFGFGAKKPTEAELAQKVRKLYIEGGNAWNEYIYAANAELPVQLAKLPYL